MSNPPTSPLLPVLFLVSGALGLVYEVLWSGQVTSFLEQVAREPLDGTPLRGLDDRPIAG